MDFDKLRKVESLDSVKETAIYRLKKNISQFKKTLSKASYIQKLRRIQQFKIKTIADNLIDYLQKIIDNFPNLDHMDEFYYQLIKMELNFEKLKEALGTVDWCKIQFKNMHRQYSIKINMTEEREKLNKYYLSFLGRIQSIINQTANKFEYLEECRYKMKKFPAVRTKLFTFCIAGFPNVGKSTLLSKLSGSIPEIKNYAFTTKKVNAGYMDTVYGKIQLIDTPGTLARNKMNKIEKHADIALNYLGHEIIFIIDLTDTYPIEEQLELLERSEEYDKEIAVYISKLDLLEQNKIEEFIFKFKEKFNYKIIANFEELEKYLVERYKKHLKE